MDQLQMCIRDRCWCGNFLHRRYVKCHIKTGTNHHCSPRNHGWKRKRNRPQLWRTSPDSWPDRSVRPYGDLYGYPVSYTHLDVYKRQVCTDKVYHQCSQKNHKQDSCSLYYFFHLFIPFQNFICSILPFHLRCENWKKNPLTSKLDTYFSASSPSVLNRYLYFI